MCIKTTRHFEPDHVDYHNKWKLPIRTVGIVIVAASISRSSVDIAIGSGRSGERSFADTQSGTAPGGENGGDNRWGSPNVINGPAHGRAHGPAITSRFRLAPSLSSRSSSTSSPNTSSFGAGMRRDIASVPAAPIWFSS